MNAWIDQRALCIFAPTEGLGLSLGRANGRDDSAGSRAPAIALKLGMKRLADVALEEPVPLRFAA